ncbi:MAG TPA: TIGR04076 family protein, partial [Terriglobales bacterium]|nr:TIGR04076 family protein [Terriglobales bacterium]
ATPPGLCIYAFLAFSPAWSALQAGGRFSWEDDPDAAHFACPDEGEVVFKLERLAQEGNRKAEKPATEPKSNIPPGGGR